MNELYNQNIVYQALENLQRNTSIKGKWKQNADNKAIDGQITLQTDLKKLVLNTEIKKEIMINHFDQLEEMAEKFHPLLIIARRIIPKIKDELRKKNIAYLEANGNIYVNEDAIMLWIDTNKTFPAEKITHERAFTKTGLKVIFQCLVDEQFINKPYREIAQITGVALGVVHNVMTGLRQLEYLIRLDKTKFKFINKKALLDRWLTNYNKELKPTLLIGKFRLLKDEDFIHWKKLPIIKEKTFWGGEPAADLVTNYLKPAELTLYTDETRNEIIKNYRMVPDEQGKVLFYRKFWNIKTNEPTVPPLLIYTDLITTGDPRCIETAKKIYEKYLQNQF